MIHGHGGNIYALAQEMGCRPDDIIDMSSNVNPLGPMAEMIAHLGTRLNTIASLPEPDAGGIVRAFARFHGIPAENVIAANGTTQLIHLLPLALGVKKALILSPTYADYADACAAHKCRVTHLTAIPAEAFQPNLRRLLEMAGEFDAVFICNPNNPTGILIPAFRLMPIIRAHPDTKFVIDESYLPFVTGGETQSFLSLDLPNVIVLSSMSKIFRIPGLRIGFMTAAETIIQRFTPYAAPWCVNALAHAAMAFLLENPQQTTAFIDTSQHYLKQEREVFLHRFNGIPGIQWLPGTTSFLLGKLSPDRNAEQICRFFARRKILLRNCANFTGLTPQYIRVSLKTRKINAMFCDTLIDLLSSPTPPMKRSTAPS